ncbi:MAG TPA: carboxypeptidase regulatory-like domain-containing protein [Candidatus Binatia bacterium]|jgi:hypothetical protein|nr:carboxypeptidase regulatory-like domain-containing protein [Candidatus Binatia bacterium]
MTRAVAILLLSLFANAAGACPPDGCSLPGGVGPATDCFVEYDGPVPSGARRVRCTDGDPSCDSDGVPNGACRFLLTACANVTDPDLPRCTPSPVTTFRIRNPDADPQLVALETALQARLGNGASCTEPVPLYVALENRRRYRRVTRRLRSVATTASGRRDVDGIRFVCEPSHDLPRPGAGFARARVVTQPAELIDGPMARGRLGDVLLVNDRLQAIIQQPGRAMFGIGTYGGTIIDADVQRPTGEERDNFEELVPAINIENTAHFTDVEIVHDGADGAPAVVRATGPDDLLDFINASSVVAGAGFTFPAIADDRDLPVEVQTDYTLAPGENAIRMDTTVTNTGDAPLSIFLGETINGSGEVELFQPAYGFGQPLVTTGCPPSTWQACAAGQCDPCNLVAYTGEGAATGVSYGHVHGENGSTSFSVSGVTIQLYGNQVLLVLIGAATPNYHLAAAGSPGDAVTVTSWFVVGDGSVTDVTDARNRLQGVTTGTLAGTVTSGGAPVPLADVAVIGTTIPGGTSTNVVTHARTDAAGRYTATLAPGSYTVRANKDGHPTATPAGAAVTITAAADVTQDFTLPATGALHVTVTDGAGAPQPARVWIVGFDPSPDPGSAQDVFGVIDNLTGVFGEIREDGLPFGLAAVAVADRRGDTGVLDLEPGSYQVVVSRGSRWSAYREDVTVTAGATTSVAARIVRVVDTPGFVTTEFHIHALASPDSEVSIADRIATQLAEGIDFFTPSEHDIRVDFAPYVAALGVTDLVATAPSAEITTFDYGHFNSWPVTVDPTQLNGGSVDWGRAGIAPGRDFPAYGSFSLAPGEIFAAAKADPRPNLVQINHIDSFFNTGGLDIDTAENGTGPPQSHTPGSTRRLDPAVPNYFDANFDSLEVWNGSQALFLGQNLGDWFNLLNQGILRTAVANSDSHERRTNGGSVRSYVASAVTDPAALWTEADTLAANVTAGRAVGTNAPFMTITARAPATDAIASLGLDHPTIVATPDGHAEVTVTVRSPLWAEFDRIELYVNAPTGRWDHDANPATRDRYRVTPQIVQHAGTDFVRTTVVDDPSIPGAGHYEATAVFPLESITEDTWVIAMTGGTAGTSRPLFPVQPFGIPASGNDTLAALTDGNLGEGGELALAFTNALYIDVPPAGWTAPGIRLTTPP